MINPTVAMNILKLALVLIYLSASSQGQEDGGLVVYATYEDVKYLLEQVEDLKKRLDVLENPPSMEEDVPESPRSIEDDVQQNKEDIIDLRINDGQMDYFISKLMQQATNITKVHERDLFEISTLLENHVIEITTFHSNDMVDLNNKISPVGSIVAWLPTFSLTPGVLPSGWHRCDGSAIESGINVILNCLNYYF